jgi:hypothetical protein
MLRNSWIPVTIVVAILGITSACTSKIGDRVLNSRYVYAKSSVTPLRNVSAQKKISGFFGCSFTRAQFDEVYDEALAQDHAANILLDYGVTYTTTLFPLFFCTNELVISGLAASAKVE